MVKNKMQIFKTIHLQFGRDASKMKEAQRISLHIVILNRLSALPCLLR